MDDQSARLFLCACCRVQVLVCRQCDRGQRYCANGCAAATRQALQRDSARRYQCGRAGRFKHALRTQRWRARQKLAEKIVTHQGSPCPAPDALLPVTPPPPITTAVASAAQPCTTITTTTAAATAATSSMQAPLTTATVPSGAWRCHWCCMPCPALVRQGPIRHSHARVPHHGHSP
jgi:hypothetical protein